MEEIKQEPKKKKINFFKKIWYSIAKFEKYPEMINEGVGRATRYLIKIILIFALIIAILGIVQTNKSINEWVQYIENNIPEIKYSNGILKSDSIDVIRISDNNLGLGNIIIDLNTEEDNIIENYKLEIKESEQEDGLIILKDRFIKVSYTLEDKDTSAQMKYVELVSSLFGKTDVELSKQDIIRFFNEQGRIYINIVNFFVYLISYFIIYIVSSLIYVLFLSIVAYITGIITKVKLRYSASYSMAIYAFTLSNILNIIYFIANYFTGFTIKYFQIAYIAVAYIYLVAVIFLIKTDFTKKQQEKVKQENIVEVNKQEEETNEDDSKETNKKDELKDDIPEKEDDNNEESGNGQEV